MVAGLVPAVPGPSTESISQRAIALRDQAREQARERDQGLPTAEDVKGILKPNGGQMLRQERPTPTPNIHKAVAHVMKNIGTIKKGGRNKFHGYDYARMEDLLEKVTPLMGEAGLAIYQSETGIQNVENNRLAVVYEFVVGHESGEERPPQRQTGVSMARDSKGNFDDKAIAKCHTNARKYFLLSLFQVPAGDFPDSDEDGTPSNANQRQEPVPGPGGAPRTENTTATPVDERLPHVIVVEQGATADQFASRYLKAIGTAKSRAEIAEWEKLNDKKLQRIYDGYRSIYDMISAAVERRLTDLEGGDRDPTLMPDPKSDSQEAMNWVASQLQQFQEYEAGEKFWNEVVAPREQDFDTLDWEMLVQEWQRFETKFPQADPPETA
jgi:hypothetical protein